MKVSEVCNLCKDYFNGFEQIAKYKKDNPNNPRVSLLALKILSYFILPFSLSIAGVYACASLYGRITKKKDLSPNDKKVQEVSKEKLGEPVTKQNQDPALPAKGEEDPSTKIVDESLPSPSAQEQNVTPPSGSLKEKPAQNTDPDKLVDDQEIEKYLTISVNEWLDIRGNTWLTHSNFRPYISYLGRKYPELFVGVQRPDYKLEGDPDPYDNDKGYSINHAILADGHFNGPCSHQNNKSNTPPWNLVMCSGKTILLYPLHVSGNHWTLVVVDRVRRSIEYYDSKMDYGNHVEIIANFKELAKELSEKDPGKIPYRFESKIKKQLQPDGYQCGIWTLYFLEERLKNPEVNFNQLDVEQAQKMIADYRVSVMKRTVSEHIFAGRKRKKGL